MKRHLALFLAIVTALAVLSGCGQKQQNEVVDNNFKRGAYSNGVYTSAFSGMSISFPEGWVVETGDELLDIALLPPEEAATDKNVGNLRKIQDMIATSADASSEIVITYENLSQVKDADTITEKIFLEELKETQPYVDEDDPELACYKMGEVGTVTMGGAEFAVITSETLDDSGIKRAYCARKIDNYMLVVNFTYRGDANYTDFTSWFTVA